MFSPIKVKNAGLVLLSDYVRTLFSRLNITKSKQFINETAQLEAVYYLQYLVTGLTQTDESFLPLNKLLCGLPPSSPTKSRIDISNENKKLIDSLIMAAISHWPAIGQGSMEGFRGNWLVRDGVLSENDNCWKLTVEKRPYDILLNKSPFSFAIIKHPWMIKPLQVTWSY